VLNFSNYLTDIHSISLFFVMECSNKCFPMMQKNNLKTTVGIFYHMFLIIISPKGFLWLSTRTDLGDISLLIEILYRIIPTQVKKMLIGIFKEIIVGVSAVFSYNYKWFKNKYWIQDPYSDADSERLINKILPFILN